MGFKFITNRKSASVKRLLYHTFLQLFLHRDDMVRNIKKTTKYHVLFSERECNLNCNHLYYMIISTTVKKREVVCHAQLFHLIPIYCLTGKLLWAALACLNLPSSAEPLISATRLIQIRFWRKAFFFFLRKGGLGHWRQLWWWENKRRHRRANLTWSVCRWSTSSFVFKRPGQLELSDFCHFDLFLFFCCNVYFNSRPPAVCVQRRRRRQKQLEGRCRYH